MRLEREPISESEYVCGFCGPGKIARWEVALTDGERVYLCDRDRNSLSDAELILAERLFGQMTWEEKEELIGFLNEHDTRNN